MKRLRRRRSSQLLLVAIFLVLAGGLTVWMFAYPPGYEACKESETRNLLVRGLKEEGFRVECRKESGTELMVKFPLHNLRQFADWALAQNTMVIYEQPGYFWYLKTGTVPGFVTYGFV